MRRLFERSGSHYEREFLHHLEGRIHLARGEAEEAVRSFERALAERPHDRAFFLRELAEALRAAGWSGRAEKAERSAQAFGPEP